MIDFPNISDLCRSTPSRIIMLVIDGLGGLPHPENGKSELETANLPNLNRLAQISDCGLTTPVAPGITPGSGPGHISLFGYNPIEHLIGRGVVESLGIGIELRDNDVAARGNFCTIDSNGLIVDRRANRIPSNESNQLISLFDQIHIPDANVSTYPVKDHRFVFLIRGDDLDGHISETDPQIIGKAPMEAIALTPGSEKTAYIANKFISSAKNLLQSQSTANMILLRGFSKLPELPNFADSYKLNPAAIAAYPMYRGLAKLIGMDVLQTGMTFDDELITLNQHFMEHDFFFLHYKPADAAGEDADFDTKVSKLEQIDSKIPELIDMEADVLIVAGDHSTPSIMGSHSWHPVPLMIHSKSTKHCGVDNFTERNCRNGSIGTISATDVMTLALAHAGKLSKFGP